jgi:hypothetical protein
MILNLFAGDHIQIKNVGASSITTTTSPRNASIVIEQLGALATP